VYGPAYRPPACRPRFRRSHALRDETPEQAMQRRMKESERVEERVTFISSEREWDVAVKQAGDRLVVVEVQSEVVCQSGWDEEPELQWEADKKAALEPCRNLKHVFQRTARDCPDVVFLTVEADSDEGQALCDRLGVEVLPTLQFWRHGRLLWEHRGVVALNEDLGEGVLYFGDTAANNEKASAYVKDLHSRADLDSFVAEATEKELVVVDVSLTGAAPCVHIFPAVLALARSFKGFASFARLMGDENDELKALLAELEITQVPTFLFFRNGKPVGRHVGSSRGDLIGQILAQQSAAGIQPPPPPPGARVRRQAARSRR
jgi:thiol-disulfide isomerase/thioredoxin